MRKDVCKFLLSMTHNCKMYVVFVDQLIQKNGRDSKVAAIMAADALAGGVDTTANTGNTEAVLHFSAKILLFNCSASIVD